MDSVLAGFIFGLYCCVASGWGYGNVLGYFEAHLSIICCDQGHQYLFKRVKNVTWKDGTSIDDRVGFPVFLPMRH